MSDARGMAMSGFVILLAVGMTEVLRPGLAELSGVENSPMITIGMVVGVGLMLLVNAAVNAWVSRKVSRSNRPGRHRRVDLIEGAALQLGRQTAEEHRTALGYVPGPGVRSDE